MTTTIDTLAHAARRDPRTAASFVARLRAEPDLIAQARARRAQLVALKASPRGANWDNTCAIEARLLTTLESALASVNNVPGVPAGD